MKSFLNSALPLLKIEPQSCELSFMDFFASFSLRLSLSDIVLVFFLLPVALCVYLYSLQQSLPLYSIYHEEQYDILEAARL